MSVLEFSKRNLYKPSGGFPAGIDISPGVMHPIGGETVWIPDIYCEDCGQILMSQAFRNRAGHIVVKVYECEQSCRVRWELETSMLTKEGRPPKAEEKKEWN